MEKPRWGMNSITQQSLIHNKKLYMSNCIIFINKKDKYKSNSTNECIEKEDLSLFTFLKMNVKVKIRLEFFFELSEQT